MTEKQKKIYDFIVKYIKKKRISPSYSEIMEGCNIKQKSNVFTYLMQLEKQGKILRQSHKIRGIEIVRKETPEVKALKKQLKCANEFIAQCALDTSNRRAAIKAMKVLLKIKGMGND